MLYYGDNPASGHGERADKNRYNTMAMMMMAIMSREMIIMISHVDWRWRVLALVDNHPQGGGIQEIGGILTVVVADN